MAQDIVNDKQNISYTNLDFSSIYTEVLDMIKNLTYKWDPSISDESDPGVILVKLSALIADKCNYNIDKSILEAFPLSVTQDSNARQLYEQLGYYMGWYEAATVPVIINYTDKSDTSNTLYKIPKFTIITDADSTNSYTLIGVEGEDGLVVSDGSLQSNGSDLYMTAMEGVPTQFKFMDESIITPQMVDENNRLYFVTQYVAQNGVFIKNIDQDNYADWKRVDNLYEQPYNDTRYKFGFDNASKLCYIEFPDNYAELIGAGIEIVYLVIDPTYNDIPPKTLDRFLSNITDNNIVLSPTNTAIINYAPASGHKNKESINEAYTNYKKVVGTFKTLTTLRDYLNYIRDNEVNLCSNAFVCDRTNDIQSTYKIMSNAHGLDTISTEVEKLNDVRDIIKSEDIYVNNAKYYYTFTDGIFSKVTPLEGDNPKENGWYEVQGQEALNAFSLKFYLLQNALSLNTKDAYDETFKMVYDTDIIDLESALEGTSHLEHTYEHILPVGENTYKLTDDTTYSVNKAYYRYDEDKKVYIIINGQLNTPIAVTPLEGDNPKENGWYEETYNEYTDTYFKRGYKYYIYSGGIYTEVTPLEGDNPKEKGWYVYNDESESYELTTDEVVDDDTTYYIYECPYIDKPDKENWYVVSDAGYIKTTDEWFVDKRKYYRKVGSSTDFYFSRIQPSSYYQLNFNFTEDTEVVAGKSYYAVSTNPHDYGLYEIDIEALLPHTAFFKNKYPISMSIDTYSAVGTDVRQDIIKNVFNALYNNINSAQVEFSEPITLDYLTNIVIDADARIKNVSFDSIDYTTYAVYYDAAKETFVEVALKPSSSNISPDDYYSDENLNSYLICKDIICKSILAGVTQLLVRDNEFNYHLNQKYIDYKQDIRYITSEAEIDINTCTPTYVGNKVQMNYVLQNNELIKLYRPALNNINSYPAGVHYEYLLLDDIEAGTSHELSASEYLFLYMQTVDDDGVLNGYTVDCLKAGAIITPTFNLPKQVDRSHLSFFAENTIMPLLESTKKQLTTFTVSTPYQIESIKGNASIRANNITGTNTISYQTLATESYGPDSGNKFYWVLNNTTYSNLDNLKSYVLFDSYDPDEDDDSINKYTLKNGEVIYYINKDGSKLSILGEGTTLYRECGINAKLSPVTEEPFEYINIEDLDNRGEFPFIVDINNNPKPVQNGFYILNDEQQYVPCTDDEFEESINYYLLLMKDVSGFYDSNGNRITKNNTTIFSEVNLFDDKNDDDLYTDKDPSTEGWYTRVSSNGIDIKDVYEPTLLGSDSGETIGHYEDLHRHVKSNDTKSIIDNVLEGIIIDGDIVDTRERSTYKSITIEDGDSTYQPLANKWLTPEYDSDTPTILKGYKLSTDPGNVFEEVSKNFDDNIEDEGFYYKNNIHDTTYIYNGELKVAHLQADANLVSRLYDLYKKATTVEGSSYIDYINANWSPYVTRSVPGDWQYATFTSGTDYSRIDLDSDDLLENKLYYLETDSSGNHYAYYADSAGSFGKSATNKNVDNDYLQALNLLYNKAISKGISDILTHVCLYYQPIYYKFKDLYKFSNKKYYKLNEYNSKSYEPVSAWSCTAFSIDEVAENPLEVIEDKWQSIQPNTKLTIIPNEVKSLSAGDTISFTGKSSSTLDIKFPIFNNKECDLDLDAYDVSIQRPDGTYDNLTKLTVGEYDWIGHSNLLVDTTSGGQTLLYNHKICLYDNSEERLLIKEITGSGDHNVTLQLSNPVANKLGEYIPVSVMDALGNEKDSSAYIFQTLIGEGDYAYYLDDFTTYLYFNGPNSSSTSLVRIPFSMVEGNYIIPLNGNSLVTVNATYDVYDGTDKISETTLHLYNDDSTSFNGDKLYCIQVDVVKYDKITDAPEGANPKEKGWYVYNTESESYELTTDEVVEDGITYYVDSASDTASHYLTFNLAGNYQNQITLVLNDLFKYTNNPVFDSNFEEIKAKIRRLDKDNIFNYTFIPKEDDIIVDPLVPKSFWLSNHICNQFTIAQSNFDELSYKFIK